MTDTPMIGDTEPRELTEDEVRDRLLDHFAALVRYWRTEERVPDVEAKMTGLMHSVLAVLDGRSELPGFTVSPDPHPDDREFRQSEGENWYPDDDVDVAGDLHVHWVDACRRAGLAQ